MERQLAERAIANQNSSLLVSAEGSPINRLRERVCIDLSAHRQLQLELYSAAALNHARGRSSCVRVDVWDGAGDKIVEHVAGVDDLETAVATYWAAVRRWPKSKITLRQGARIVQKLARTRSPAGSGARTSPGIKMKMRRKS
jgi:hypothetical protein